MAGYFGEDPPRAERSANGFLEYTKTKWYTVLRPRYWEGQQHGGRDSPLHTRYMRPFCEIVSSSELLPRSSHTQWRIRQLLTPNR